MLKIFLIIIISFSVFGCAGLKQNLDLCVQTPAPEPITDSADLETWLIEYEYWHSNNQYCQ